MLKVASDAGLDKIKKAVMNLPVEKKMEVLTLLEEELFAVRFKTLLTEFRESAKKYPVTTEEITREVEAIRKKRYEGALMEQLKSAEKARTKGRKTDFVPWENVKRMQKIEH